MINPTRGLIRCALASAGLIGLIVNPANADRITYTEHVAPILFEHCVSCHRPDTAAPMSLLSYAETRPWAKSIREQVVNRSMPPWFADPAHGRFRNDPSMTDDDIDTIVNWVEQGAVRGNPDVMLDVPVVEDGWQLGIPDYIVETPAYTVPASGDDIRIPFEMNVDADPTRWVRAVEIRPGNRNVTHHSVVFINGYPEVEDNSDYSVLGVWAVGTPPNVYPEGTGRRLSEINTLVVSQHYHPYGEEATDSTRVGLYFGEGEMGKDLKGMRIGNFGLRIPPHAANHEVLGSWTTPSEITLHSFFPHMHYRGKDMTYTATYPDGGEEILLRVPKYDFNWQYFYYLDEAKVIPKGTTIDVVAHFDNSSGNPDNPDPSLEILYGEDSDDEMMFGIFEYTSDDPIDINRLSFLPDETEFDPTILVALLIVIGIGATFLYNGRTKPL
jgi:hypothetical protein